MCNKVYAIILVVLVIPGLELVARGETFECAFIQEKYPNGKSNKASCSMLPEKVYSRKGHTPTPNQHCEVEGVHMFEDLTDFKVDTEARSVIWTSHIALTDDAKPKQKAYYLTEGLSEEEAEEKVNFERKEKISFRIASYHKSNTTIFIDEITGKILNPPKKVPEHNLILFNNIYLFFLYIPEASGHAILLGPTGMAEFSWINIRFGKCRKT